MDQLRRVRTNDFARPAVVNLRPSPTQKPVHLGSSQAVGRHDQSDVFESSRERPLASSTVRPTMAIALQTALADNRVTALEAQAIVAAFDDQRPEDRSLLQRAFLSPTASWLEGSRLTLYELSVGNAQEHATRQREALRFWEDLSAHPRDDAAGGISLQHASSLQPEPIIQLGSPATLRAKHGVVQPNGPLLDQGYWMSADGHTYGALDRRASEGEAEADGATACASLAAAQTLARLGYFSTEEAIDMQQRVGNIGASQQALIEYFQTRGLAAELRNGGTWEELREAITSGYGVMITGQGPHMVCATGILLGSDGYEYIRIAGGGSVSDMRREQYERLFWQEGIGLLGNGRLLTGIRCSYVVVGRAGSPALPRHANAWAEANARSTWTVLDGAQACGSGLRQIFRGAIVVGASRLISGVVELAIQAPAAVVQAAGAFLEMGATDGLAWARANWGQGASNTLLAAITYFFAALAFALGTTVRHIGQLFGFCTSLLARTLSAPCRLVSNAMGARRDALNALRMANQEGTERERFYWRQLVSTPALPGKLQLLTRLLDGRADQEAQAMTLRLLRASSAREVAQLVSVVGIDRLDSFFSNDVNAPEWGMIRVKI